MNPDSAATTPQWAVIELMGHVRYGGQVSKDNQFGTAMLRVDVPQADGTFVSQLVNPASIYRITMCSEEIARAAAKQGNFKPLSEWSIKHHLMAAGASEATVQEAPHPEFDNQDDDRDSDRW